MNAIKNKIHHLVHLDCNFDKSVTGGVSLSFISFGVCFNCHDVSVDIVAESSTTGADAFPGAVRVISIGSYAGTLLLDKNTMFPIKEQKLPGALKLLLFKV